MSAAAKAMADAAARRAYPRRPVVQLHYARGWLAECGCGRSIAELTGSIAEDLGAREARRIGADRQAELAL